ncbi:MAG: hypothetical protein SFW62_04070 [Alphaproteobacteria bacterium]|nr:hypothetical protein [Alphaproteobacteria bacterium]
MPLPKMLLVRQHFPDRQIHNVPDAVTQQMHSFPFADEFQPGARIAIGVGSRGIHNIPTIVRSVVDYWKGKGLEPFIFPAMGSHGGATDEGQKSVLATLGITESTMACPIVSSMDIVPTGRTPDGIDTVMDRAAYESAGIFLINRVKWHTDFEDTIESGLFKMMTVGMGKLTGAKNYHRLGYEGRGLGEIIRSAGRHILSSGKVLGGLAILEDANNNTAHVETLPAASMERREEELLVTVKGWKENIPLELDVLIVNEIGKMVSGPGMDPKVVNRSSTTGAYNPWKNLPWIGRIYVRSLRPDSRGNAMGIGMADVIHDRVLQHIDERATGINALTAQILSAVRVPMHHFSTDRECLETIVRDMTFHKEWFDVRMGWIRNSMELSLLGLSENLEEQIRKNPQLEIIGKAEAFAFDDNGQLVTRPFDLVSTASRHMQPA